MTTPKRRIRVNPHLMRRQAREFTGQLTRIKNWLMTGRITLRYAKALGKQAFDEELERLISVTMDELKTMMRGIKPIPPDELDRMEKWKEEELARFNAVLDDVAAL